MGNFGGSVPHCFIAFETHKTAEPIEMPFGIMSVLGSRNSVLRGVTICKGEEAMFGQKYVPDEPNTHDNCELDWSMQRHTTGSYS